MGEAKGRKSQSTLLLVNKIDKNLKIAGRNIKFLDFNLASDTHAYEVLAHQKLIITKDALDNITDRLKK
jgi:ribosomal protein L4